ncbi:hypothetical protein PENTCL1PPCAC_25822, partial [Pristionchus entomophagus]
MESSAFDQLLRLGDELQEDYGHIFDAGDHFDFEGAMDGDSLSLLLSDMNTPCSLASSYSGMDPSQSSSSSSPAVSHASSNSSSFPYQDMMADASPLLVESPPLYHHHEPVMPIGGGGGGIMNGAGNGHYEDYASPSGTYSDDSGHHSPVTPGVEQPLYDLEAGCYDYGCVEQQQHLLQQRRSSSEDSSSGGEFAAPAAPAARRVLRMQQQSPPAADPPPTAYVQQLQQQPARVVYVLPPQQQQRPQAAKSMQYNVTPPPKVVQARPPQQQPARHHPAAPAAASYQPVVVKQQGLRGPSPKTTVLLARTTPCVQLVSTNRTALLAPIKVETKEEITEEEDMQYFRKQEDRKQKNRAAAQQSRLRRRCELDELRTTVAELTERNRHLETENGRLKRRVQELESHSHWSPPRKRVAAAGAAATCLMVFVMMFALQPTQLDSRLSPFSLSVPVSRQILAAADTAHSRVVRDVSAEVAPKTRALLAIEDYDEAAGKKESAEMAEYAERLARSRNVTRGGEKEGEGCGDKGTHKRYPNQTETIRLNTELNAWVESHDLVEWASGLQGGRRMFTLSGLGKRRLVPEVKGNETVSPFDSSLARVQLANRTTMEGRGEGKKTLKKKSPRGEAKREAAKERAMRDRAWKHLDMVSPGLREHGPENRPDWSTEQPERMNRRLVGGIGEKEREWRESYERLAAAVQQRTDTLYVVAMKDYLLLPAIERNATSRPRVSIILPAVINGTMTTANNQV